MKTASEAAEAIKAFVSPKLEQLATSDDPEQAVLAMIDLLAELCDKGLNAVQDEPWEGLCYICFAGFLLEKAGNDRPSLAVIHAMREVALVNLLRKVGTQGLKEGMADLTALHALAKIRAKA